ncbi:MAG: hypothetical protein ACR2HM_10655 [Acidimicrobiales bacterium]
MLLAFTALAAGLTGCGDGGVSKSAFLAKADAACTTGAVPAVAAPSSLPELAAGAGGLAGAVDSQVAALRALKAPGDDTAAVAGLIAALAAVGEQGRTLQDAAARTDDPATAHAANNLKGTAEAASAQAQAYGLGTCGKALEAPVATLVDGGRTVLRAAFVARADALCTAANRKVDALAAPGSLASTARYLAAYLPIEEKLFADIRALTAPPGDDSAIADMLASQDKVIAKDRELLGAAQRRSQAELDRLDIEELALVTAANAAFDAYNLRSCGTLSAF